MLIDPCMGSGHILVYAFDVFMQIYVSEGWTEREAAKSILKNNLYGLDIDERAYQLSYFALMMKARQYNRRILSEGIIPNVMAIEESNTFKRDLLVRFGDELKPLATKLIDTFIDAKEYGSILNVDFTKEELDSLDKKLDEIYKMADYGSLIVQAESYELVDTFDVFLKQARIMSHKYDCVVTNPPYLNNFSPNLKRYVGNQYPSVRSDLFSVFMMKNFDYCNKNGYSAFLTPNVWLSIKSYENLRKYILEKKGITTLIQMAHGAFNEVACVDVCAFVLANTKMNNPGIYFGLSDFKGDMEVQNSYVMKAIENKDCNYRFITNANDLLLVPDTPITAFSASNKMLEVFRKSVLLKNIADPKQGLATADNNRFLRQWFEVSINKICFVCKSTQEAGTNSYKWFPYNKGGYFRKWYGNNDYIVNWENDGFEIKHFFDEKGQLRSRPQNTQYYFKECISWSLISSYTIAFRYKPIGHIFDIAGMSCFTTSNIPLLYLLGLNNSCLIGKIMLMLAPTINYQSGNIANIPVIFDEYLSPKICALVQNNIAIAKEDWDQYETSWDFTVNPLTNNNYTLISDAYNEYKSVRNDKFNVMKRNEEQLNKLFLYIYDVENEMKPDSNRRDISTTYIYDTTEEIDEDIKDSYYVKTKIDIIKELLLYAVGCMFGRYSLDTDGLAYAGGEWDSSKYISFIPDSDNIIPICDDEYFEDDIVHRFVEFIKVVYGEDTLDENLQFIADTLGGSGTSREIIRNYFLNDFFIDHTRIYQKRPIYWQFDSGKKNGFKALMYIHRYTPDLIARMRTSYIHELQSKYSSQISMVERQLDSTVSTSERVKVQKRLTKLREQEAELRKYEELVHHWADRMEPMDLDDGVKANYAKFQELLTKIK